MRRDQLVHGLQFLLPLGSLLFLLGCYGGQTTRTNADKPHARDLASDYLLQAQRALKKPRDEGPGSTCAVFYGREPFPPEATSAFLAKRPEDIQQVIWGRGGELQIFLSSKVPGEDIILRMSLVDNKCSTFEYDLSRVIVD